MDPGYRCAKEWRMVHGQEGCIICRPHGGERDLSVSSDDETGENYGRRGKKYQEDQDVKGRTILNYKVTTQ